MHKYFQNVSALVISTLCCSLLVTSVFGQAPTGSPDASEQKVKAKIEKIGLGGDLTVKTRAGGEFYGSIKNIGPELVTIREVDLRQDIEFRYSEIKSVDKEYGETRGMNGKRIAPKKHLFGLLIGAGLLAAILIGVVAGGKD